MTKCDTLHIKNAIFGILEFGNRECKIYDIKKKLPLTFPSTEILLIPLDFWQTIIRSPSRFKLQKHNTIPH